MALSQKRGKSADQNIPKAMQSLLAWYKTAARDVPWRLKDAQKADPYKIWLSEIMCQQTTVQAVKPYYDKFTKYWPDVSSLASAPEDDILAAWAGLGYYARARNLIQCARIVATKYNGQFPQTESELRALPGIGEYTAAAICAFAYNQKTIIIDGNVERIMARFFAVADPIPQAKTVIRDHARIFYSAGHSVKDAAQALMDLGAMLCIPRTPRCLKCPLNSYCQGYKTGQAEILPVKVLKLPKPKKFGYVYISKNRENEILFHRRPPHGLLGGMIGLPTSEWVTSENLLTHSKIACAENQTISIYDVNITHIFTHFELKLIPVLLNLEYEIQDTDFFWERPDKIIGTLPTLFEKVLISTQGN